MALAAPGATTFCIVLTVNCVYHSDNAAASYVTLCFVDCQQTDRFISSAILF